VRPVSCCKHGACRPPDVRSQVGEANSQIMSRARGRKVDV
jgi:hypothetical protein